jgi:hypothetical protein
LTGATHHNHRYQNYGQHHSVLSDILALFLFIDLSSMTSSPHPSLPQL